MTSSSQAVTGYQDVEVADRFTAATERTCGRDFLNALQRLDVFDQLQRRLVGVVDEEAPGDAAVRLDRLQNLLLGLLAHTRQRLQLALFGELFDAIDVANFEGAPDELNRFRPESADLQQFEHRGLVFADEFLVLLELAGVADLGEVVGHALADAGDLKKSFLIADEIRHLISEPVDGFGSVAVGADTERVLRVDLHEIGGFVKQGCDGFVIHSIGRF